MIKSFKDKETAGLFHREYSRRLPPQIQRKALTKLWMIHMAHRLEQFLIPPSNRLELLKGDRKGQYSIRINKQWRVCFYWVGQNAHDVEIVDYH
jgi:proteic killer suppression protein